MNDALWQWVTHKLGAPAERIERLTGSTSSTLYRLRASDAAYVVRIFDNRQWLAEEPDLARHEAAALLKVHPTAIPSPAVIAYDETGAECGGLPAIIMTLLPGQVVLQPPDLDAFLRQMAETLAAIHALPVDGFPWAYFPWGRIRGQSVPEWTAVPEAWAQAIAIAEGPEPAYQTVFLHRDYHPGNVLWQNGRISGVIDWPNACRGPAGVDLAHCRTNLVALYGIDHADRFLAYYQQAAGPDFGYDPYWDVIGLVAELAYPVEVYAPWEEAFGLEGLTVQRVQAGLDSYVTRVLAM
jgi:aminoglycoside phosphotransferase (APT) family kinase protein